MSVFRPIYDWALKQAKKPYADALLFLVALTEPCISPMPPDILMIPMAIAHREKAFRFALICLVGLVLGSIAGYGIGALAMKTVGLWIVNTYHLENAFVTFHEVFDKWGMLILVGKGFVPFIPIPLIFLMVASGAAHFNPIVFGLCFALSQGARLFLEAWLIRRYGEPVQNFIERRLTWIGMAIVAVVAVFVWLVM